MTRSRSKLTNSNKERASILGSKASVTVEAALTIPIFLFAVLSLVYLLEIQSLRTCMRSAVQSAAKTAAEDVVTLPAVNIIKLKSDIVNNIGSERVERSILSGGSSGIHCGKTYMSILTGEIHVNVEYKVKLPFPGFTNLTAKLKETMKIKGWNGYADRENDSDGDQIVYITENALVYHEDYQCTYLQLSVRFIPASELGTIHNDYGGRYHKCDKCVHGEAMAGVYVTNTGGKYHNSLNCSGLKRTVYAVKKSEAGVLGGCSRCTK